MSLKDYLRENGTGRFKDFHVPNLIPGGTVRLVIIAESPHTAELEAKHPLAGRSGKDAAKFLEEDESLERSLGAWVKELHSNRKSAIALLNVSQVPLQKAAFAHRASPRLSSNDWKILDRLRENKTLVEKMRDGHCKEACILLAKQFEVSISTLPTDSDTKYYIAGKFAWKFWQSLPEHSRPANAFEIPHPSYSQWPRKSNDKNLDCLRRLFKQLSS